MEGRFVQDSVDSSHIFTNGRGIKFRNKRCRCRRKAEVLISESINNRDRLFFRCKTNQCGFFEWWNLEDDNPGFLDELGSVSSSYIGRRLEDEGFTSEAEDEEILQGLRGIKRFVNILAICVLILFVVILMK